MSSDFLSELESNAQNVYFSQELENRLDLNDNGLKDVFYVKINDQKYDLEKYKNTGSKIQFSFFLEKPQFKKIILSNFNKLDLYIDNINARTFTVEKENISIKIKKLKNTYKVKLSLKRNLSKKEIL